MLKTRLTLTPGANGTKKLVERYGKRLVSRAVSVRPRPAARIKTVELIEEETPLTPSSAIDLVQIGDEETAEREKAREAGGRWNRERKETMDPERGSGTPPGLPGPRRGLAGTRIVDIYGSMSISIRVSLHLQVDTAGRGRITS